MSENLQTPERAAEAALAEYKAYGPETDPMQIEPEKMADWIAACEGAELTARQHCDLAWLKIEYAGARSSNKRVARQIFLEAENELRAALKHPEADHYTKAKAFWATGSLPLIQAMLRVAYDDTLTKPGKNPQLQRLRRLYNRSYDFAASETYQMVQEGGLSPHETAFCQTIAVGYHLTESTSRLFSVIPGVPRCYEDTASSDAWHATVWDARGYAAQLKLGRPEESPDYLVIEGLALPGQAEPEDGFTLLHDTFRLLTKQSLTPEAEEELLEANIRIERTAVAFFDRYSKDLKNERTLEASSPKFALEGLTAADLPGWYLNLSESRLFRYAEAIQLDKLAVPYLLGKLTADTEQSLALQYLRLECALAMADSNPAAAQAQLTNFELSAPALLPELQERGDITAMYETSLQLAIIPFYRALLQERAPSPEVMGEVSEEIGQILSEILWEKNLAERSAEEKERLSALLLPAFNALFLTIISEGKHLYLPALERQRTATINYWDINAWRAHEGRYVPAEIRKLRLVASGRLRQEGDIACVPLSLMGQRSHPDTLVAAFVADLTGEASPKSTALLKRHGPKISSLLSAAWHAAEG